MAKKSLKNLMILVLSVSLVIGTVLTGGCAGKESETPNQETQPQINETETPAQETQPQINGIETPAQEKPTQIILDIIPQVAFTLIQENQDNPDFVILDVQSPEDFADGHIENAVNVDYSSEPLRDVLNKLDKNKIYLIYQRSDCECGARSSLSILMEGLNFKEAYIMSGGFNGWLAEGLSAAQETPAQIILDITPHEAFTLIQENRGNPDFVIIDARTPEEFVAGHIEDAINIDYRSETFKAEFDKLGKNKTYLIYFQYYRPYLICCGGHLRINTLYIARKLNFREVYNISGGFDGWVAEGLPAIRETQAQIIENISPQEAFTLTQENQDNPDFVIIDIQTPEGFAKEHIENAINIDYRSETFEDELDSLEKNKTYLIYYLCACGGRDRKTVEIMEKLNFGEVYKMSGGA